MGSRSKYVRVQGEATVPRAVLDVLMIAVGAKAASAEQADIARATARKLQRLCRQHYVSAKRLRDNHKWNTPQSYEPWAIVTGQGHVVVIPKSLRRASEATLREVAVRPAYVFPQDEDDRADAAQEWVPLGNSGKGKPTWALPEWSKLVMDSGSAGWLKEGLAAAIVDGEKRPALIRPSPETNVVLAYCYDLCAYWANPDKRPPPMTAAFDQAGALTIPNDGREA